MQTLFPHTWTPMGLCCWKCRWSLPVICQHRSLPVEKRAEEKQARIDSCACLLVSLTGKCAPAISPTSMQSVPDLKGDQEHHQENVGTQPPEEEECAPTQSASPKALFYCRKLIWLQYFMHPYFCRLRRHGRLFPSFSRVYHFISPLLFLIVPCLFPTFPYDGRR